jgi:hypothetical protein
VGAGEGHEGSLVLGGKRPQAKSRDLVNHYAKRWTVELSSRNINDLRYRMGMSSIHTMSPARRDPLWLFSAFAIALLTLLGAAGDSLRYGVCSRPTPSSGESIPYFIRTVMLYNLIPDTPQERLRP